jgi:hypothetical protein
MTYKNTDSTVLKSAKIGNVAIGTQVVFHNDGLTEDIHIIVKSDDTAGLIKTVVVADEVQDVKYPFTHDPGKEAFILKTVPTRQELLFDEDED